MNREVSGKEWWTLFAVAGAKGKPLSPVQLQKTVFLFQKLLSEQSVVSEFYDFTPYNYGPFAREIYIDAERLSNAGLIDVASNGRYSEYLITSEGEREAEELVAKLPLHVRKHMQLIVDWVKSQSFKGLVSAIYEEYPEYRVNSIFTG